MARPIIKARQVAFNYPQSRHGLDPISLVIQPGEIVLVCGTSGCGKSTLARCLTGMIPHLYQGEMAGDVWLDGMDTRTTPLWQLSESAGLVFQNPAGQMLAQSVEEEILFGLENLGIPRQTMGQRLEETLDQFNLDQFRHRSPQTLSGGEQQKLALAAITARRPPVLVLDEPLSMLDGTAANELIQHLEALARAGTSIVVCEHRAEYLSHISNLEKIELNNPSRSSVPSENVTDLFHVDSLISPRQSFQLAVHNLQISLGNKLVLDGINLDARGGQVIAIVGRNGVGKTTLLRAIAGLQEYQGEIAVENGSNQPVQGKRPPFGMVFQNSDLQLFNATVRDEILYRLPDPNMTLYKGLLKTLGLTRYEMTPPLLLSEGEKKRLALAIAMMHQPRYGILLDEPALGQDAHHKSILIRVARLLAGTGMMIIFTTHDLSLAMMADRLMLLTQNGFIADNTPATLLQEKSAWEQIGLSVPPWITIEDLNKPNLQYDSDT
ncbi:MAG: ATP-binding cassette domain-containing protein [Anaerolineales bacterium]|nr:ATP-binding cassette domain-containing protein [Anaerolineales bacterium]